MPDHATDPSENEKPRRSRRPEIDSSFLESLVGYSARRAAVTAMSAFVKRMAKYDLRPLDFSVLSLVGRNPGMTSRQLCQELDVLPPNLVGVITALEKRKLLERQPHPTDRRAAGLHLTTPGIAFVQEAELTASQSEADVAHRLTAAETRTLVRLLRKIYR